MKEVTGNLISMAFDGQFDVIVHGTNCYNNMGSGIAKEVRLRCPGAYWADQGTNKGDEAKLGTITCGSSKNPDKQEEVAEFTVVNAYTQHRYGRDRRHVDYDALRSCFKAVKEQFAGKRIGYPLIGAGLAGGDWEVISAIIDEELDGEDHTLVRFDG
jgi:O-acetyl-ADP-ribose deacetylase (regulator of RNase III)